jgi:phospholipase/carboxylesterase
VSSLHHVTTIASDAQANVDFYSGFLGLRLIKWTAGAEDPRQLHLFYGDGVGSPGTLVRSLIWESAGAGRAGHGAAGELALAIPMDGISYWLTRCLDHRINYEGPTKELGETVLRLKDPDGLIVKLVAAEGLPEGAFWRDSPVSCEAAIRGVRAVTLFSETADDTVRFLETRFDMRTLMEEGTIRRLAATDGRAMDVRDAEGFWPAAAGAGTIDHVALRASTLGELRTAGAEFEAAGIALSLLKDRKYFASIYFREPGGALLELATDAPGMTVDEPVETLGERLFIPEQFATEADDLRIALPQITRPGAPHMKKRDLPFAHRIHTADLPDGDTLFLLHGTGGDESDLLPLGAAIAPNAQLFGLRGRSLAEGVNRWFSRQGMKQFDQAEIRSETEALAFFAREATTGYGLDPARITWVGYSNGANMIGALALHHPGTVKRAILFRAMPILDTAPEANLSGTDMLVLNGTNDPYNDQGRLAALLRERGAQVLEQRLPGGHNLQAQDRDIAAAWYAGQHAAKASS